MTTFVMPVLGGLSFSPHASLWFLFPLFPAAVAVIVYLYFAQRRLVSKRTAWWLTIIRVLLILLLAVLFLQPAVKWLHNRTSAGELWVLVDQSPSMQSTDPQTSAAEKIRWAEALGYLPAECAARRSPMLRWRPLRLWRAIGRQCDHRAGQRLHRGRHSRSWSVSRH